MKQYFQRFRHSKISDLAQEVSDIAEEVGDISQEMQIRKPLLSYNMTASSANQLSIENIYYINSRILCVCVSVSVFVTSEISAMGCRSGTLLSPTWRASRGELCRLVFQFVRCMVREKKPLELFHR